MPQKPAYVLRDANFMIGGVNQAGQCTSITIPVVKRKMEPHRGGGMIKPRMLEMGLEATATTLKGINFDPRVIRQHALVLGENTNLIAYGYMKSEAGQTHSYLCEMVADLMEFNPGDHQPGEKAEVTHEATVHETRLFIDDELIYAINDFEHVIGGVDQSPGRANALRLN